MFVNTVGKNSKRLVIRMSMKGVFIQEKFLAVNCVEKDSKIFNMTSSEST